MATGKRYYWMKLKESFMTSDTIDYFMSQQNGANYVVLYQMLCLKTINTDGRLSRQIGEIIIQYDVEKIRRDLKWFSADTIRVALELYKAFGLIYEDKDGVLTLADHQSLVGSETDYGAQKRRQRQLKTPPKQLTDGVDIVHQNVHTDIDIRDRDIDIDIRDIDIDIPLRVTGNPNNKITEIRREHIKGVFERFSDGNDELLNALKDFERMRIKIKDPMTERAKTMLVNKLQQKFKPEEWIPVLEQSIFNCWKNVYPLKAQDGAAAPYNYNDGGDSL